MPHPANKLNTIRMVRGQTKVILVTVKTAAGRVAQLGAASLFFTLRKGASTTVLIAKKSGDGIEVTDAESGEATITLDITDTDLAAGEYRFDVWVTFPATETEPEVRQPVVRFAQAYVTESLTTDFTL